MKLYFITLSNVDNSKYVTSNDIAPAMEELTKLGQIKWMPELCRYEVSGRYRQLHFHGLGYIPNNIQYSKFTKIHGPNNSWSLRFKMVEYDPSTIGYMSRKRRKKLLTFDEAVLYVTKDDREYGDTRDKLTLNKYRHENMFKTPYLYT